MKLEMNKNELAGALSALGKLICRTSPVEAFRSVQIEGKENKVTLRTANTDESIAFSIAAEVPEPFQVRVNFDDFRTAVRGGRNKSLTFSLENGLFAVDGMMLRPVEDTLPDVPSPANDCISSALPSGFVSLLATMAPLVDRNNYREYLKGIHLCPEGLVVTNGKELLHIPQELTLVPLTLPFPLALLATKCEADGMISTWSEQATRYFSIELGGWKWTGKALNGTYPNWKTIVPDSSILTHVVKFNAESVARLMEFLKKVPDASPANPITLSENSDGHLLLIAENEMRCSVPAEFSAPWNDFSIIVSKAILARLLGKGHTQIACENENAPFIATQGIGTYAAMPLAHRIPKTIQPPNTEENKMNENSSNTVTAPVQSVANTPNPEPAPSVTLDDLASAVDELKAKFKLLFDDANTLSRKIKEVALTQKQKERDFILAKRAIERIRMAI